MAKFNIEGPLNPSIADVIDAFARAYDSTPRTVIFHHSGAGGNVGIPVCVTSLQYESGTPGMFNIEGRTDSGKIAGFYNANTHTGFLRTGE